MKYSQSTLPKKITSYLLIDTLPTYLPADSTRETGVLQAYFAAGAVKGIAAACHNQRIRDCVCNFDGPVESTDAEGNLIYRSCKEDAQYSIDYVLNFIFPDLTVTITTARYRVVFRIVKNTNGTISTSIERTAVAGSNDQPTTDPTADPDPSEPYTRILNDVHNTIVGLKVRGRGGGRERERERCSELLCNQKWDQSKVCR
jgi:hypothetical protein